jgi:hypothetical protein
MRITKFGLLLFSIFSLMVYNFSDTAVFGEDYAAGVSREIADQSLINQSSDKVDYFLRRKLNQMDSKGAELQGKIKFSASLNSKAMPPSDSEDKIQVYIHVHSIEPDVKSILESYEATVEIINKKLKAIQAWIPRDQVHQIAQLSFVRSIRNPAYAVFRNSLNSPAHRSPLSGGVTTEGDAILRADEVRAGGLIGNGAKVGVITDGVANLATAIASGDLPDNITVFREGVGDEGTALLEIIYDMAPGAELAFCGVITHFDMIDCIDRLANTFNADILIDDVAFFDEPYFEDGDVAKAVNNILSNRVYVSAAGNESQNHYTGNFIGANTLGITKDDAPVSEHDFGVASGSAPDSTLDVTLGAGETTNIYLQWNDPFGGSGNDYDLHCLDSSNAVIKSSESLQDGDDDPFEWIELTNTSSSPEVFRIAVTKVSGEDKQIKLFIWSPAVLLEYAVSAGSIFGHPAVSGVLTTAAIHAADPGNDTISDDSSQGPVEIFFPSQETRQKPDITAIDCVSISGAGSFPDPPFCGTSAAAPHVAGVAALLVGGSASADQANQVIKSSAVDLGSTGFDTIYGHGRIDAFSAAQQLNLLPSSPQPQPQPKPPQPENDNGKGSGTCFISTVR